jgi:hypothetical protein
MVSTNSKIRSFDEIGTNDWVICQPKNAKIMNTSSIFAFLFSQYVCWQTSEVYRQTCQKSSRIPASAFHMYVLYVIQFQLEAKPKCKSTGKLVFRKLQRVKMSTGSA